MLKKVYRYLTKKDYRKYVKNHRKHLRYLLFAARHDKEYDWGYIIPIIRQLIAGRIEYFENGYNVFQSDESRLEIVQSLKECLCLIDTAYLGGENSSWEKVFKCFSDNMMMWWD